MQGNLRRAARLESRTNVIVAAPAPLPNDRAELLTSLRKRMAEVSGKVGAARQPVVTEALVPEAPPDFSPIDLLPIPDLLAERLPGGLPRGVVAVVSGARSLSLAMVAAVTAAGGYAAVVGQPDLGLLAIAEMGGDLSRLAVVPDPGPDPVEVAAVLMDGMDLVLLGLAGQRVTQGRARAVTARARHRGCTLLAAGGDWPGAVLRLDARVRGYGLTAGAVPGCGRIDTVRLATEVSGSAAMRGQSAGGPERRTHPGRTG